VILSVEKKIGSVRKKGGLLLASIVLLYLLLNFHLRRMAMEWLVSWENLGLQVLVGVGYLGEPAGEAGDEPADPAGGFLVANIYLGQGGNNQV
jgi:hypothetical protein